MEENNTIKFILCLILAIPIVPCFISRLNDNYSIFSDTENIPVSVIFNTKPLSQNLNCQLFVFWKKTKENDLMFKENTFRNSQMIMNLKSNYLLKPDGFPFAIFPILKTEIEDGTDTGFFLSEKNIYEQTRIRSTLSRENYYEIYNFYCFS